MTRQSAFTAEGAWQNLLDNFLDEAANPLADDVSQSAIMPRQVPAAPPKTPAPPRSPAASSTRKQLSITQALQELDEVTLGLLLPMPAMPAGDSDVGDFDNLPVNELNLPDQPGGDRAATERPLQLQDPSEHPIPAHHFAREMRRARAWIKQGAWALADKRLRTLLYWFPRDLALPEYAASLFAEVDDDARCIEWLFCLANRLCEFGNFDDMRGVVDRILRMHPDHPGAQQIRQLLSERLVLSQRLV